MPDDSQQVPAVVALPPILLGQGPYQDDGWSLGVVLAEYLRGLNEQPNGRRQGIYSPSSISKCLRALYYNRIGVPQLPNIDPKTRFNFDIGHAVHKLLNRYVTEALGDLAEVEIDAAIEAYNILGELDFQFLHAPNGPARRIIDFKTIKSAKFKDLRQPVIDQEGSVRPSTMTDYVWQLHTYMAAKNCPLGTLFYVNKDTAEWFEARMTFSHAVWDKIEARVLSVEENVSMGIPPVRTSNTFFCGSCAWHYVCMTPEALANG